jgi:hypothetical protein
MIRTHAVTLSLVAGLACASHAQQFFFSTGQPDKLMAAASRPETIGAGQAEIETADDFNLSNEILLTSATFDGLIPLGAPTESVTAVDIEIYRTFPVDSDMTRTPAVPTRNNSPSDVARVVRVSGSDLRYTVKLLGENVGAANSVINGIKAAPNQRTLGDGPVSGRYVQIRVTLNAPLDLPPGHYFFVPQTRVVNGTFLWLSAPKPIGAAGTPFVGDLQAWIRNADLDPDWLRIGGDIIGGTPAPAFNMTFSLGGLFACYANCDASTAAPVLNVNDFTCFLNRFAAGDAYANCDNSSAAPTLNVLDFACFLNKFAAGCT